MNTPFFSIIIPVYNVEEYLERCVSSVLSQSFDDYEIILINDGSSDDSGLICDRLAVKDSRIRVFHKENGGAASARNLGITNISGFYTLFLDSDDLWESKSALESIYKRIKEFNEDVVLFGCRDVFPNSNKSYISRGNYDLDLINKHNKFATLQYLNSSGKFPGAAWILAVRSSIISKNNLQFPVGVTAEDIGWVNDILVKSESIGAINDIVYNYLREREGQVTSFATLKGCKGMILSMDSWLADEAKNTYPTISYRMAHLFLVLLMHFSQLKKEEKKILYDDLMSNSVILKEGSNIHRQIYIGVSVLGPNFIGRLFNSYYRKFVKKKKFDNK